MKLLLVLSLFVVLLSRTEGYPYIWGAEEESDHLSEDVRASDETSGSGEQEDEDGQDDERKRSVTDEEEEEKEKDSSENNEDKEKHQPQATGPITVTPFKAKTGVPEDLPQFTKHPGANPFYHPSIIPVPVGKGINRGPMGSFFYSSPYGPLTITPFKVTKNKKIRKRCMCAFPGGCPEEFSMSGSPCGFGGYGAYGGFGGMPGMAGMGGMGGMGGGCGGCGGCGCGCGCGGGFGGGCGCGCGGGCGCPGGSCGGFNGMPMPQMVMCCPKSSDKESDESSSKADESEKVESPPSSQKAPQADSAAESENQTSNTAKTAADSAQKIAAQLQSANQPQQSNKQPVATAEAVKQNSDKPAAALLNLPQVKPVLPQQPGKPAPASPVDIKSP